MSKGAPHGRGRIEADRSRSICCDVLDAWFPPSPQTRAAFHEAPNALKTSPEVDGAELVSAIAKARNVLEESITLGAGSSEIIHRVLGPMVAGRTAVVLDPSYSEYGYVLERNAAAVKRIGLDHRTGFRVELQELKRACADADIVALVNPNNPTGQVLRANQVLDLKAELPPKASLWVDEAYVDFAPTGSSIESAASETEGIYLLKSMSKAYALSGARAAYLVCRPVEAAEIRAGVPPWIIGTAAQSAAIAALGDHDYHADRWRETRTMVCALADELQELGLTVIDGYIGAVLIRCPLGKSASSWQAELASLGVIVRTPVGMGEVLGEDYIRIGLTDPELMPKVVDAVKLTLA